LSAKIAEFFQFALDNYDSLDHEAKSRVDAACDAIREQARGAVEAMPDGIEKRQAKRYLAVAEGEHFTANGVVQILERPSQFEQPIVAAAHEVFMQLLQRILDVMYDVTRQTHRGPASFAKVGLCYWAVDELLVAIHLAQRAFTNQAYAHIRTVFEILDKIELFDAQPEWAQVWVSADDKKVRQELSAASVRQKLGNPRHDPIYSFFSELGPHGTFKGLQARGAKAQEAGEGGRPRFKLWVGGCPMQHHIVWTHTYCVHAALATLVRAIKVFSQYLNGQEMRQVLDTSGELATKFFRDHYVEWAKQQGLDARPLLEHLEKQPWRS